MIWREKKWLLLGLAVLLAVNCVFFLTYRVRYEERVRDLDERLEQTRRRHQDAQRDSLIAEKRLEAHARTVQAMGVIYDDWWSTEKDRLAPLIVELHDLADRSQLIPQGRVYATEDLGEDPRQGTGARTMTISFSVQGTYERVRQLINMIELSDHFIIIRQIAISEASKGTGEILTLNLTLKTLFHEEEAPLDT